MEMRQLGGTDLRVSLCGLGTMTWGKQNTEAEGHAQMDYALAQGVNFWDAAELYPIPPEADTQGRTEEIIGTWLASRKRRADVVIATKIVGRSGMLWFRPDQLEPRHTRAQIDFAVERSLKRLGTDYIDLYQLHWPDRRVPMFGAQTYQHSEESFEAFEDILEALTRHVEAGRIRHLGLSNETPWGVMRFLDVAEKRGWPRMVSIQNAYNLVNRTFEFGLAEIAHQERVGLLAYSPLAQGYLSAKYRGGALPPASRRALFQRLGRYETPGADAAFEAYFELAAAHGLHPVQLALKFCATRSFMTSVLIGATTMEQLTLAIDAFDTPWSEALERAVNSVHGTRPNPCP
jgi:aryl-alcohol dehydrogenase-like predicted oxidoreductase